MNGIVLKPGVKLFDLAPQIVLAVLVAQPLWGEHGLDLVITSLNDSGDHHSERSLHAIGHAVDLRTRNLPLSASGKRQIAGILWTRLGGTDGPFDVVFEGADTPSEHIHVEYQPHRAFI